MHEKKLKLIIKNHIVFSGWAHSYTQVCQVCDGSIYFTDELLKKIPQLKLWVELNPSLPRWTEDPDGWWLHASYPQIYWVTVQTLTNEEAKKNKNNLDELKKVKEENIINSFVEKISGVMLSAPRTNLPKLLTAISKYQQFNPNTYLKTNTKKSLLKKLRRMNNQLLKLYYQKE